MSADQLTILAVDDEPTQLADLARLLRALPVVREVECAMDGHDALVKASAELYDAIFLDVRMPDLDGLELGRVLRRFAVAPQLVFVSAHDDAAADAFELHARRLPAQAGRAGPASRTRSSASRTRCNPRSAAAADERATAAAHPPPDSEMVAVANLHGGATRLIARGAIRYRAVLRRLRPRRDR